MAKTYFLINRPQFDAMLIAEPGLAAELFGTNGNNGRLVEVTADAGLRSNNGQQVIYKTSKGPAPLRLPEGVDPSTLTVDVLTVGEHSVWAKAKRGDDLSKRPSGRPENPGKPARGLRAIIMTNAEMMAEISKAEWPITENA